MESWPIKDGEDAIEVDEEEIDIEAWVINNIQDVVEIDEPEEDDIESRSFINGVNGVEEASDLEEEEINSESSFLMEDTEDVKEPHKNAEIEAITEESNNIEPKQRSVAIVQGQEIMRGEATRQVIRQEVGTRRRLVPRPLVNQISKEKNPDVRSQMIEECQALRAQRQSCKYDDPDGRGVPKSE